MESRPCRKYKINTNNFIIAYTIKRGWKNGLCILTRHVQHLSNRKWLGFMSNLIQHAKPEAQFPFLHLACFSSQPPAALHSIYFKKLGRKEAMNICCPPTICQGLC